MGTRADFYVGRGVNAQWLGSVAMDGYPDGPYALMVSVATTAEEFSALVESALEASGRGTRPADGWPWPWKTSATTDYAYAFDDGAVWVSNFGGAWIQWVDGDRAGEVTGAAAAESYEQHGKTAVFPDMTGVQRVTFGPRSGLIVLEGK